MLNPPISFPQVMRMLGFLLCCAEASVVAWSTAQAGPTTQASVAIPTSSDKPPRMRLVFRFILWFSVGFAVAHSSYEARERE